MKTSYLFFFVSIFLLSFSILPPAISQTQNCLDFDGNDDLVLINPGPEVGYDDFTVEFWAKTNYNNPDDKVMMVWDCAYASPTRLDIRMDNGNLSIYAPSIGLQISPFEIPQNEFFHVALTNGTSGLKVYANCQLVISTSGIQVESNIRIGRWCHDYAHKGQIDDFRIWNYIRTESEIQSTMNLELVGDEPGLIVYLDFNDGIAGSNNSGITTAIDKTGNGFDGILYDFSLTGITSNWVSSQAMNAPPCILQPEAAFTLENGTGCVPLLVEFSDESEGDIDSWNWSFPGGTPSSSTEQNPQVIYNTPGLFDVTLEVTNAFGSNSITFEDYILVFGPASASFDYSVNNSEVIFNNTTQNAIDFQWDFGDNSTSTQSDPSHDYAQSGIYTVQLIAFGDCGSDTTFLEIELDIVLAPVAAFSLNNGTGCAPLVVQFMDQSVGEIDAWEWSFPGGTPNISTAQNPQVVYQTPGTFDVTLEVTNSGGGNVISYEGYINVELSIFASYNYAVNENIVTFTNTAQNASAFQWNFGDNSLESTEENPVHQYTSPGVYLVTLVATNPLCGSAITNIVDVLFTGIKTIDEKALIKIFPNPVTDILTIKSEIEIDIIQISNALGQQILEIFNPGNTEAIDISNLSPGIYLINFLSKDQIWSAEFVKQ